MNAITQPLERIPGPVLLLGAVFSIQMGAVLAILAITLASALAAWASRGKTDAA